MSACESATRAYRAGWYGVSAAFEQSFAGLCAGTIDTLLTDTSGQALLDVGCGTGRLARAAVAAGRDVVAVDADRGMLERTRFVAPGAHVVQAALPHLGLTTDRFDCVIANFVVNHLDDPRAGIRELARVVRPGGHVAVTSWTSEPTPRSVLFAESFAAAGAVPVPGQRLPAHLDFERSVTGLRALLGAAGVQTLRARELRWTWRVSWPDLWAGLAGGIGASGETYLAQDVPTRRRIEAELRTRSAAFERDGVLHLPSVAACAVGVRTRWAG